MAGSASIRDLRLRPVQHVGRAQSYAENVGWFAATARSAANSGIEQRKLEHVTRP